MALTVVEVLFNAKIGDSACSKLFWLEPGMLMVMILAAETLLIMRVWALWDRAIWVPYLFVVMVGAEIGVSIWSISEFESAYGCRDGHARSKTDPKVSCSVGSVPLPVPPQLNIHTCILTSTAENANRLWLYWFCPVVTDTVIVLLVVMYVLHSLRDTRSSY